MIVKLSQKIIHEYNDFKDILVHLTKIKVGQELIKQHLESLMDLRCGSSYSNHCNTPRIKEDARSLDLTFISFHRFREI